MEGIKIKDVTYKSVRLCLKKPFLIANERYSYCDTVIVKLKTNSFYGIGEAAPDEAVTGENINTVMIALKKFRNILVGSYINDIGDVMHRLDKAMPMNQTAKAGLNIALYDAFGKFTGKSVCRVLGGRKLSMETCITIGIENQEESIKEALHYTESGFKILKVKIGLNPKEDERKLRLIREAVGDRIRLLVDANQGYGVKEAISFVKNIKDIGIEILEQPVSAKNIKGLKTVMEASDIPIMADESIKDKTDLDRIIKLGAADMINIKLMKAGGISAAVEMAKAARENGIKVMTGCMEETKIGITAGMHFSLSSKGVDIVDLDSHLSHTNEIVQGGVLTHKGINSIYDRPGLGLELKEGIFC